MEKKIIIHFGPPKTGTSAIQYWAAANQTYLESHSVWYPVHSVDKNNISSGNVEYIYSRGDDGKLRFDKEKARLLIIDFNNSQYQTLLLSSEHFFYHLDELTQFFTEACFLGFIRSPLEYLESSYNQSIKRHGNIETIPCKERVNGHFLRRIGIAIESAGTAQFHLRAYGKQLFGGSDIVDEILHFLAIPVLTDKGNKQQINTSYCFEALELMRWFNQFNFSKKIELELDRVLQIYREGTNHFSVVPPNHYTRYKRQSLNMVRDICKKHEVVNGEALLAYIEQREQKNYLEQTIRPEQAEVVLTFIRENKGSAFFNQLCEQINSPNQELIFNTNLIPLFAPNDKQIGFLALLTRIVKSDMSEKNKCISIMRLFKKTLKRKMRNLNT